MRILLLVIGTSLVPGAGYADIYSDCKEAVDAGDRVKAKKFAKKIIRSDDAVIGERREISLACINYAMDEEYVYDFISADFLTQTQIANRDKNFAERVEENNRERQQNSEIAASLAELERRRKKQKDAKEHTVWLRVEEACRTLYKKHPDETVTNRICLDIFLLTGLPDD